MPHTCPNFHHFRFCVYSFLFKMYTLRWLISEQFLLGFQSERIDERLRQVVQAVIDQSNGHLDVIDLSNPLHRGCLYSFLRPIYLVLTRFLNRQEPSFTNQRFCVWISFAERHWRRLHQWLVERGFSVENAQLYVELNGHTD